MGKHEDILITADRVQAARKSNEEPQRRMPKRRRGHDRVAVLLEASAKVFVRKGYEAATMTEIAAEANSSIGSLYQFFPTKPLLAEALHVDRLERLKSVLGDIVETSGGLSPADSGEAIFDRLAAFIETFPEYPVLAARRDVPKERKMRSRTELKALICVILKQAKPSVGEDTALMAAIILELLRIAVLAATEPEAAEDGHVVRELRLMLRKRLDEAAAQG